MNKILTVLFFTFYSFSSYAESGAGSEGGIAYGDIGAEETAQRIANISVQQL